MDLAILSVCFVDRVAIAANIADGPTRNAFSNSPRLSASFVEPVMLGWIFSLCDVSVPPCVFS